ncbi:MAG: prepilin peptidase [Acidobacteria bacterium]|jgi:prepilin peptidase CpaA|nr:prepilin peptidase [Acidobacteriota bacterium]
MKIQILLALLVGVAAVVEDLRFRTISNWTTLGAMAAGVAFHVATGGLSGLGSSLLGLVVGFCAFLVFYLLGGMGGGDVKLMAGFGAILGGATASVQAAIFAAGVGGILALAVIGFRWLKATIQRRSGPHSPFIPYAPAITAGAWLTLLARS